VAEIDQDRWKSAYLSEIRRYAAETPGRVLNTVYFGGGTPSLMQPDLVGAILDEVRKSWRLSNSLEITLEANPTSVEAGRLRGYRDAGVNRISMGLQALNDADLRALGRLHTVAEAKKALETAQSTFDRVSFDLIYARQGQTLADWRTELTEALTMAGDHLSLYQLTIEDGTAFGDRFARGLLRGLPDEDLAADMYDLTQEMCDNNGLAAYEVSNHALPGGESRHNLIYWQAGDYLGIGPGAHGRMTLNGLRHATDTPLAPTEWLQAVESKGNGELSRSPLSPSDQQGEYLMMGLRLKGGISRDRLFALQQNPDLLNRIKDMEDEGLLESSSQTIRATDRGRPVLNAVIRELLV